MTIKRISKKAGFVLAIAGAAIVGGAATAVVSAAIPSSSDGQIHGCYRNSSNVLDSKGSLRVINAETGEACTAQETSLAWNQQGPKGDQGDPGPQGPAGTAQPSTVGNQMSFNWGDIPENGTPVKFLTIPGFGDINITRCDADGISEAAFTNTSGEPIRLTNEAASYILQAGETISTTDGPTTGGHNITQPVSCQKALAAPYKWLASR